MLLLRFLVAVMVALPLFLAVGGAYPRRATFLVVVVAWVAFLIAGAVLSRWRLNMLLRKALAAEERGDHEQAIALFEQALRKADWDDDAMMIRRQIQAVTNRSQSAECRAHQSPPAPSDVHRHQDIEEEVARFLAATDDPELNGDNRQ
jgi:hypothetical protein